jgi:hypothetical protein
MTIMYTSRIFRETHHGVLWRFSDNMTLVYTCYKEISRVYLFSEDVHKVLLVSVYSDKKLRAAWIYVEKLCRNISIVCINTRKWMDYYVERARRGKRTWWLVALWRRLRRSCHVRSASSFHSGNHSEPNWHPHLLPSPLGSWGKACHVLRNSMFWQRNKMDSFSDFLKAMSGLCRPCVGSAIDETTDLLYI